MQSIAEALGIDYAVCRALVRAWLRMSFRSTAASASPNAAAARGMTLGLNAVMYLVMGLGLGVLCYIADDKLGAATLTSSFVMVIVASMVLLDHATVMTSPTDHVILGWRPISSRTYFAARLAVILIYTLGLALFAGFGPVVGFLLASGGLWLGIAAGALVMLSAVFASLTIVFSYAWVLRAVGPDRLKRALTYLQLGASFAIYGGYMLPSLLFDTVKPGSIALPESPWLLLYPPFWFASYIAIGAGTAGMREVAGAALSAICIIAAVFAIGNRVSLDYADRLGGLMASAARVKARRARRPWFVRSGETRAMTLLIRAQFRHDQAFRTQILALVPIVFIYFLMALREGSLPDPFTAASFDSMGWTFIGMTVLLLAGLFQGALPRSDAYKASWIYFAAPVERSRVVRATKIIFILRVTYSGTGRDRRHRHRVVRLRVAHGDPLHHPRPHGCRPASDLSIHRSRPAVLPGTLADGGEFGTDDAHAGCDHGWGDGDRPTALLPGLSGPGSNRPAHYGAHCGKRGAGPLDPGPRRRAGGEPGIQRIGRPPLSKGAGIPYHSMSPKGIDMATSITQRGLVPLLALGILWSLGSVTGRLPIVRPRLPTRNSRSNACPASTSRSIRATSTSCRA